MMQIKSDQRRSFSFSSFDFNSCNNNSTGFFSSSSSSDEFYASNFVMYDTEDDDDDDDDGAYIEINLNPTQTASVVVVDDDDGDDGGDIKKEYSNSSEVELRISFSSSAAGIPPPSTCRTTQHAQGTTTTTKPRGRLFVALARIVNEFMAASSAKTSNSVRAIEANNNVDCKEIIRSREDCTMAANSKRNGIMNFIVKFKYKDIPSMLVSMVTPKAKSGQMLLRRGSSTCCRDPMNDNMKLKTRNDQDQNRDKSSTSSSVGGVINFKAMRGILDTLIVKTGAKTGKLYANNKYNKTKSCPSSIKSSPMHTNIVCGDNDEVRRFYSRDNSVQAAIAHCKKSFDFHL